MEQNAGEILKLRLGMTFRAAIALLTATAAISFCCVAVAGPADQASLVVDAAYASAQDAVRGNLRDPGSATFNPADARFFFSQAGMVICGLVNARNGFGGYAGPTGWIAIAKHGDDGVFRAEAILQGQSSQYRTLWRSVCQRKAVPRNAMERELAAAFAKSG